VERAEAADPTDQANILQAVETTIGFHELNIRVNAGLRGALVGLGKQVLHERTERTKRLVHAGKRRENMRGVELRLLLSVAKLLKELGKGAEARPMYEQALEGYEATLGPHHHLTLCSADALATLLSDLGEHAAARQLFERALAGREQTLGRTHLDTLRSCNNLAILLNRLGERMKARDMLCYAMLCYAMPCHAMPCHAMLCYAMLC
jgi:tetratricopeptide (TPR) repeat protein